MAGYGSEELEGLRLRVQSRLMLLQQQLTSLGRLEQDLGSLGAQMARIARRLPEREDVAVRTLQAALARTAEARDTMEEDLALCFDASERPDRSTSGDLSAAGPGQSLRGRVSPRVATASALLADVRQGDVLLFETGGIRYAVEGPLRRADSRGASDFELGERAPFPGPGVTFLRRPGADALIGLDRVLGRLRRRTGSPGLRGERLRRQIPGIRGRFRLRGEWYYVIK